MRVSDTADDGRLKSGVVKAIPPTLIEDLTDWLAITQPLAPMVGGLGNRA